MGKHETGYIRVSRDFYPTPSWVVEALGQHVYLEQRRVWEPACGRGHMVDALRELGAKVHGSDIKPMCRGGVKFDFLNGTTRRVFDLLVTNPPYGERGKLAEAFLTRALTYNRQVCLLLPADYDSAKSRWKFFRDERRFMSKIVLTKRIVWFTRKDGVREAPKENHAWYVWRSGPRDHEPELLYA